MTSKTKILQALEEILLTKGAGAVSVRHVCQQAGVNHGLVPHYFGNKEGMLKAGLKFIADRKIKRLLEAVQNGGPETMVVNFTDALAKDKQFSKVLIEFHLLAGQSEVLAEALAAVFASRTVLLMTAFGLDRPTALFFQSSIIGIQVMRSTCGQEYVEMAAQRLSKEFLSVSDISPESIQSALQMIETTAGKGLPGVDEPMENLPGDQT